MGNRGRGGAGEGNVHRSTMWDNRVDNNSVCGDIAMRKGAGKCMFNGGFEWNRLLVEERVL